MKNIKKLGLGLLAIVILFTVSGCETKEKNVEGTLEEIMTKVYEGIPEDSLPMMIRNTEITKENMANYIGTDEIEIQEGLASESMVGSIAHSVVLLRVENTKNIEEVKQTIKEKVNPNKWICVGVENVIVENKGNLIIVILEDELGETLKTNFENL